MPLDVRDPEDGILLWQVCESTSAEVGRAITNLEPKITIINLAHAARTQELHGIGGTS
ncbi:hypothetical protein AHiyo8_pI67950 (plasmid) [Arthrobacter sp. Hiyo8]|nr:hypothetical protein AHiyo8_pI67950 [Arthrobacter sp. Hiyo8]